MRTCGDARYGSGPLESIIDGRLSSLRCSLAFKLVTFLHKIYRLPKSVW